MLRGSSLAPRRENSAKEIPSTLKYALFEYPSEEEEGTTTHVRVFDHDGNLTTQQVGVHSYAFRSVAMFYMLRAQSWHTLLAFSIILYLGILALFSVIYYLWSLACGAHAGTTPIVSLYFAVVSLAANGGYMGEDTGTMSEPSHRCYTGRALIVMACSYANIVFVGLVAALVVGKAEYTGKLGTRVVFSDFCALTAVPGKVDEWKLTFRIANMENMKALAHGHLRLFCMEAEPLKEYRLRKRALRIRRYRARAFEQQRREALIQPLTMELLKGIGEGGDFGNASITAHDPTVRALLRFQADRKRKAATERRQKEKQRAKRRDAKAAAAAVAAGDDESGAAGTPTSRDKSKSEPLPSSTGRVTESESYSARGEPDTQTDSQHMSTGRHRQYHHHLPPLHRRPPQHDHQHHSRKADPQTRSSSSSSSSGVYEVGGSGSSSSSSSSSDAFSHKTNSSVDTPEGMSPLNHNLSPISPTAHGMGRIPSYGTMHSCRKHGDGSRNHQHHRPDRDGSDDYEEDIAQERVRVRVNELRWACAEETYLDRSSHQLSLWYPVTITHTINERSPLYRFMEAPRIGAALTADDLVGSFTGAKLRRDTGDKHLSSRRFQLIAEFDATDMETGAVITAKRTYTTTDIMTHYKFSNKLVHMKADSHAIMLDYHYFNEMLPVMAVESSTTDSGG